jgi:Protein of unknown function (DUF1761)
MILNYTAVLVAAIAAFIFGAAWYGVLGKQWMAALGKTEEEIKEASAARKMPLVSMVISFIAELIMAFFMAGLIGHLGAVSIKNGALVGGFCWLAFVATTVSVNNAYSGRKLALTIIDSGHWLGVLLIVCDRRIRLTGGN